MHYAIGVIGFCIFCCLVLAWIAYLAPEVYEDDDGWHPDE